MAKLLDYKGKIVWDPTKPNGQPRRLLDVSRAREKFGFQAEVKLDEGLRRTIDWYLSTRVKRSAA
jgi:GDP-L-fucose synthase